MRLVHDGSGGVVAYAESDRPLPLSEGPPKPLFKIKLKGTSVVNRSAVGAVKNGTNYQAGFLYQLGTDQCRYTINDETGMMCGAEGFPWCKTHKRVVYRGYWK